MLNLVLANPEVHYPVWGTCLGMEQLVLLTNNDEWPLTACWSRDEALPFISDPVLWSTSQMGRDMPKDILEDLEGPANITYNYHR